VPKSIEQRVRDASRGVLEPSARQRVASGIYDELRMSDTMDGVVFENVVLLNGMTIRNGTARGTIIVPIGAHADLGGSLVNVRYWSWEKIDEEFDV